MVAMKCSTLSGGTAASASTRGPDSSTGLDTAGTHALVAVLSYGCSHSAASKCARAATQAQCGCALVLDRVFNPIKSHWRFGRQQMVGVDQHNQPLLQVVEMGGGDAPTGAGALQAPHGTRDYGRSSLH